MRSILLLITLCLLSQNLYAQVAAAGISVGVTDKNFRIVESLTESDFVLTVNGVRRKIISAKRESRNLSIIVIVLTNPFDTCLTSGQDVMVEELSNLLGERDQLGIVVSNREGTVIRELSRISDGPQTEFSRAIEIAERNKTPTFDELGIQSGSDVGRIYPLIALKTATVLLDKDMSGNDKMILFVRNTRNTVSGSAEEARTIFGEIIRQRISVSWMNDVSARKGYSFPRVPYGSRDFFFSLPSLTGGYLQPCERKADEYSVVWGKGKVYETTSSVGSIIRSTRDRYRLLFDVDGVSKSDVAVEVRAANHAFEQSMFNYQKTVLIDAPSELK
jgi:hypothetical protein